jgi:hypothetical protein
MNFSLSQQSGITVAPGMWAAIRLTSLVAWLAAGNAPHGGQNFAEKKHAFGMAVLRVDIQKVVNAMSFLPGFWFIDAHLGR